MTGVPESMMPRPIARTYRSARTMLTRLAQAHRPCRVFQALTRDQSPWRRLRSAEQE